MSKVKKVFAIILSMAMILGMSLTTFAAPDDDPTTSNIKVKGLASEDEATTVNLYAAITWDKDNSTWVIAEWAEDYINTSSDPYRITNAEELVKHVEGTPYTQTLAANANEVDFENIPVGAYVITASGTSASYAPMVVETYKSGETYMTAEDKIVTAKTDGYDVTKQQVVENLGEKFVGRGETVTFSITTSFPSFDPADSDDNTYKIVDTPTGLDIQSVSSITIGGTPLAVGDYTVEENLKADGSTESYTIDLTNQIGNTNANAGKTVVVTYTAIVTSDEGYSNTANAYRNDSSLGEGGDLGYTADITITKYADDGSTVLKGAQFEVYPGTKEAVEAEGSEITPLYFVKTSDGVYKLALSSSEQGATTTIEATNGTVQVKGLAEGTYWFKETLAPEGYSINSDGVEVEITEEEAEDAVEEGANISKTDSLEDTKLAELPSTGGIGTTIFTVGGCAIMIAAAALFFASRRKESK